MQSKPASHPLREAADRLAKVQRDRGDGLYIARATLPASELFLQEERAGWTVLLPSDRAIELLETWLDAPENSGFERFNEHGCEREDRVLLAQALKLMETNCRKNDILLYERALRQRAAVLLRTHSKTGGRALSLCMRIVRRLSV